MFKKSKIEAMTAVVPQNRIPLLEFSDVYGEDQIRRIMRATGIEEVTVAAAGMTSSDYSYEAARILLSETGVSISDVDALIYVTDTPDYLTPGTAPILQDRLGLSNNTINMDLRYSCSGYVYGLFQASLLVESGYCNSVIVLAASTGSQYVNEQDRSMKMLLGDAACATLVTASEKMFNSHYSFYVDGSRNKSLYVPAGGARLPIKKGVTDVLVFDEDGNGRTQENVHMNGMDIMMFSISDVPKLIKETMAGIDWTVDDVDLFGLHQANKMIVSRLAKALKANPDKVPIDIAHTGNCGLSSVPLVLCNQFEGVHSEFKKAIICGFGSGLLASCCAVNLSETKIIKTRSI